MLTGAAVLTGTAVSGVLLERHAQMTRAEADQVLVETAARQASEFDEHFERSRTIALMLAHDNAFSGFYQAPGDPEANAQKGGPLVDRANSALGFLETLYPGAIGEACFIDQSGHEYARVVKGTVAPAHELSHEEASQPFFAPTMNSPIGTVHHSAPYVSPDTGEWVIANATVVPGVPKPHKALVHFELSIESFRGRLSPTRDALAVQVVDANTGRVLIDSRVPQAMDAPLGPGAFRTVPTTSALLTQDDERIAVDHIQTAGANNWAVVALGDVPDAVPLGLAMLLTGTGILGVLFVGFGALLWHRGQRTLRREARTDVLTGLPNRAAFATRAEALLESSGPDAPLAVLLCDLDRFKDVNDTLGHHVGDELLVLAGARLQSVVTSTYPTALLARLGGDEFAVVMPGATVEDAATLAVAMREALNEPFHLLAMSVHVGVSVGIALSPLHGLRVPDLLQRADVAMYAAKRARQGHAVYAVGADHHSRRRLSLGAELRDAFVRGELVPAYQPLCDPLTRQIRGVEALVRWRHPTRGPLLPGDFLPIAEETGLIRQLTPYLLGRVLADARRWIDLGTPLRVSVNLTASDLVDPGLPDAVAEALHLAGVPAQLLCLEVTEQHLLEDRDTVFATLHGLRKLGVLLAIDDYGTGYCGLAYLRDLPVDYVKIDRSFVMTMMTDRANEIIVRSSMELAHRLGFRVVAEGVEDADALPRLVEHGCELAQGFLLGEPMPPAQIELLLTAMATQRQP